LPKDGSDDDGDGTNFRGRKRSNDTHPSTTDPDALPRIDRRTTRHSGYARSLSRRWLVEKTSGWLKGTGPLRQVKLRGLVKVDWIFDFSCAAHNLLRLPRLLATPAREVPQPQCA